MDRWHNRYGGPTLDESATLKASKVEHMAQLPYYLDDTRRRTVLSALLSRCAERGWFLFAAHVRTNHVHLVVDALEEQPERLMSDLKAFASRRLNLFGLDEIGRKRWARHGSTRRLWKTQDVVAAIEYVVNGQGQPMAVYEADLSDPSTK